MYHSVRASFGFTTRKPCKGIGKGPIGISTNQTLGPYLYSEGEAKTRPILFAAYGHYLLGKVGTCQVPTRHSSKTGIPHSINQGKERGRIKRLCKE